MTAIFDVGAFDLDQRAEKGAELTLCHPVSGKALGVSIVLRGTDAPSYRAVVRQQIDQQITEGKVELSAAELEQRHIERLVAATVRWQGVRYHAEAMACNAGNARRLYQEQVWIREQVAQFVEDRARFLPG